MKPQQIIDYLKSNNIETKSVKWKSKASGEMELTQQQLKENKEWIDGLKLEDGYLCSTFEPVLFLMAELKKVNIIHTYCGTTIEYLYPLSDKTVKFNSSKSHFN